MLQIPQSDPGCSKQPRVLKFDSEGNFITKFGSVGKGPGQFKDPEHLAIDHDGNVYVSDRKNNDIQKFSPVKSQWIRSLKLKRNTKESRKI